MSLEVLAVVLFVLFLGVVALAALGPARAYIAGNRPPDPWPRAERIQQVKEARRMERRRDRVWWKVDTLHAEYLARTSAVASNPPAPTAAPAQQRPDPSVSREQVDEMFAAFLSKRGGRADQAPAGKADSEAKAAPLRDEGRKVRVFHIEGDRKLTPRAARRRRRQSHDRV